jgi:hypothetical protein
MNRHHHPEQDRLEDYADGTLSDLERRQLDIHLAQCQACRDEVTAIRELLSDLRGLPREVVVEEEEEMWAAIGARINSSGSVKRVDFRRRLRSRVVVVVAAAAVLFIVAVPSMRWLDRTTERPTESDLAVVPKSELHRLVSNTSHMRAMADDYRQSMAELWSALRHQSGHLAPETVLVLEKNLTIIDAALRESQAALAADPSHKDLLKSVAAMEGAKVQLLRRALRSRRI